MYDRQDGVNSVDKIEEQIRKKLTALFPFIFIFPNRSV